jgi:FMN phosphatase YigB (HAD superfamily)
MKLLTDFDGVITDLAEEARRVRELFEADLLAAAGPAGAGEAKAALVAAERACDAAPHAHGWMWEGRVTAFVNEDPFVRVNGIAARLDADADCGRRGPAGLRPALVAQGRRNFRDAAQAAYVAMTHETAAGRIRPLDPEARDVIAEFVARGVETVVVSNSGTERILALLRAAGLDAVAHGAGAGPLRVRGDAKKYVLGADPAAFRSLAAGVYDVAVDRPHYEAILREEAPDFVMGDVFSLDLALPLSLRRAGDPAFRSVHALLRARPYTPQWPVDHLRGDASARWSRIDRLAQVLDVVR